MKNGEPVQTRTAGLLRVKQALGRIEHVTTRMAEKAEAGINEILKAHSASDIVAARDNILLRGLKAKAADKGLPY